MSQTQTVNELTAEEIAQVDAEINTIDQETILTSRAVGMCLTIHREIGQSIERLKSNGLIGFKTADALHAEVTKSFTEIVTVATGWQFNPEFQANSPTREVDASTALECLKGFNLPGVAGPAPQPQAGN